jgi:cytochrome b subunit of formate dehydrogenase
MQYFVQWGKTPWNEDVLMHASWTLVYVAIALGLLFMLAHTVYVVVVPKPKAAAPPVAPLNNDAMAARIPERVKRHSLGARMFHWIMAASMLTLLFTAFVPILGLKFAWVQIHWIAGLVLTASIVYHIIHATFFLDFWSIWISREDIREARARTTRALGGTAPEPRKAGKYPFDNKMYHTAIVLSSLAVVPTGLFMMKRVQTPFFIRDPYFMFAARTWGYMYVLHGLTGIALVFLTMAHVYFAIRPEKFWITKSMIFGTVSRKNYLEHHDPARWVVK